MTDRRIERSVSSQLAGLEERMRGLETLIGGGSQKEIQSDRITGLAQITTAGYGDANDEVGPQVTVNVGHIGAIQALVSVAPWPTGQTLAGAPTEEARIALELSGANTLSAANFASTYGYLKALVSLNTTATFIAVTVIESIHRTFIISGLAPGPTTVTMKYQATQNPAGFINVDNRDLLVAPF